MSNATEKKIAFALPLLGFYDTHFRELTSELKNIYDVYIIYGSKERKLDKNKKFINFYISRNSLSLVNLIKSFFSIIKILRDKRFDVVYFVGIYMIVLGIFLFPFVPGRKIFYFSGLGSLYTSERKLTKIFSKFLTLFIRFSLRILISSIDIFENTDDLKLLSSRLSRKARLIKGLGVNSSKFYFTKESNKNRTVLFSSRLIRDKGVAEVIKAAKFLHEKDSSIKFIITGNIDQLSINSLSKDEFDDMKGLPNVTYLGYSSRVDSLLKKSNIAILPSYREGLPRFLLEAMSSGRAIITTDVPGCREVVKNNFSGILIPKKDWYRLAEKIILLMNNNKLRHNLAKNAELSFLNKFSIEVISREHIKILEEL